MGGIFPGWEKVHAPNMLNQFPHRDEELGIPVTHAIVSSPKPGESDSRAYGPNYLYDYPHTSDGKPVGLSVEQRAAQKIAAMHPAGTPQGEMFAKENADLLK